MHRLQIGLSESGIQVGECSMLRLSVGKLSPTMGERKGGGGGGERNLKHKSTRVMQAQYPAVHTQTIYAVSHGWVIAKQSQ